MSQELENKIVGENEMEYEELPIIKSISIGFGNTDNDIACRQTDFFNIIESVISKETLQNTKEEICNCNYQVETHFKKYNLFITDDNNPRYEDWKQTDMIDYIAETCNKITNKNILDYDAEEDFINYIDTKWFLYFKSFVKNILKRFNRRLEMLREEQDRILREETKKNKHNEDINCECGEIYTKSNKQRHLTSTKHQNWILTTNDKKNPRDIIECECGGTYTRSNFYHHKSTSQHCYFIENNTKKPTTETCQCGIEYEINNKKCHMISQEHLEKMGILYDDGEMKKKQKRLEYTEKAKEQVSCECGGKYTKCNKYTHCQSKRHIKYMISINSK